MPSAKKKKSSLADRYLAAIQGCSKDGVESADDIPEMNANNTNDKFGKQVKIEYTYRPPQQNSDEGEHKNGNTTAPGGNADVGDSNEGIEVNVFPTSSTEEETTTDEEGDDHNNKVKKREVSVDNGNFTMSNREPEQPPQPPEFATIPLRRVGATTATGSSNNSTDRRNVNNSVALADAMSEVSEPMLLVKKKEDDGITAPPKSQSGGASATDNDGQAHSQTMLEKEGAGNHHAAQAEEEDEDNYSFKPIEGMGGVGEVAWVRVGAKDTIANAKSSISTDRPATSDGTKNDQPNANTPVGGAQGSGGGKVKMWASKFDCRADTTTASSVVGMPTPKGGSLASTPLISPLMCVQTPVVSTSSGGGGSGGAMRKASANDGGGTSVKDSADADDMAAALRKSAIMVKGSASPGRRQNGASPLREKEIWQRRRKERERRASELRQKEEEEDNNNKTPDGSGSVVSVPKSTLSTPGTEVHTNRTSDFRRNLWLDRSAAAASAATNGGGTSGAGGGDEGVNSADVANPQEEETDSESDNPDLAADAEVRRLSQSESERAAARRVTTTGKGGKASSFAPVGGKVTPLTTEVGAGKDDESINDKHEKSAHVAGVKVDKSKGELDTAIGTSRPPRTPKVSVKPGLVAARQKAFSGGGSSGTNKAHSPTSKYRTKKSLADDISQTDSSIATPAMVTTDDIVDAEVDDVAEPLPQGFTPSIKADVSLTSSTDVELGVIQEETAPDDGDKEEGPLTGKSFKINRASRNTGKKKKKKKMAAVSSPEPSQSPTNDAPSSGPAWAQVKLRKTSQGAALQQKSGTTVDKNSKGPLPASQKSHASSLPVQSLRPLPSGTVPEKPQRPLSSPTNESQAASSVDWTPAQFSPAPFSARKDASAFQDGPEAPILLGQEYISRRVTNAVQQNQVESFMSEVVESFTSEGSVQNLRHKFESTETPKDAAKDDCSSIRVMFEEMASPRPSGREAVTNTRQVFEKKTVRDRAPQQVPLCEPVFQQYDGDVDGRPDSSNDAEQSLPTPKGVRDVRSTFEPEPKRFSPDKVTQQRSPQGRQSATPRGIDDDYRSRIDNWMAEVKEIRSRFDSKPDPLPPGTTKSQTSGLSKAGSKDSGDRSQPPTPRWLDIDTNKTAAVSDSPFKSFDAQAKQSSSALNQTLRTPYGQSSSRLPSSAAQSMASMASWSSNGGGRHSSSLAIDLEDAVTLSPQSTVVSELTPSTLPPATMLDNQSRDGNYSATSSTRPSRTPTLGHASRSVSTPVGLMMKDSTPKSKGKSKKAASEVIPRSPDPPGKTATVPRTTDPPASEEKVDVSISPIPYRPSPENPVEPVANSSAPSSTKADNHDSWKKKEETDTAWTDFDAFGGGDPFGPSFTADFSAAFNAFQSEGTTAAPSTKKNAFAEARLDDIPSPPRVKSLSFDSEGSMPIDDAISISTANTPLRSNRKSDSASFDMSDEIGLTNTTRPIRPKHVLTNDATSAVSKRLDELKEARRARQSGLSQPKSNGDFKSSSDPIAPLPSALRSSTTKRRPSAATASSPPRTGITSKLSQVTRIGKSSSRGKDDRKETAEIPLVAQQEDQFLFFEGIAPEPFPDPPSANKKKKGNKGKGLSRFFKQ